MPLPSNGRQVGQPRHPGNAQEKGAPSNGQPKECDRHVLPERALWVLRTGGACYLLSEASIARVLPDTGKTANSGLKRSAGPSKRCLLNFQDRVV